MGKIIDKGLFFLESLVTMLAARYLLDLGDIEEDLLYCVGLVSCMLSRVRHVTRWYTGWEYVHLVRGTALLRGIGYA